MHLSTLERQQVWFYLAAIVAGLLLGGALPAFAATLEALMWPAIALLLYATFVQVPLLRLRDAFADRRFLGAVLTGNFLVAPALAWMLVQWLPPDPALRLGVLLVLLVPCTDWFIAFARLGGGDAARAIAVTPLNLLLQLLLLPGYLWLMSDAPPAGLFPPRQALAALLVVLLPLLLAVLGESWFRARRSRERMRERMAWLPVPLLAVVLLLVAATQIASAQAAAALLATLLPLFAAFLLLAALAARVLSRLWRLPAAHGRTLAFSMGTRNSFLVLPFALALPQGWEAAAIAIVVQSLVELLGMIVYLRWIPRRLFPPG